MNLISFIVPAYNESFEIGKTLDAIMTSAKAVGVPFEVIVVNDNSSDDTAAIARQAGAQVLDVKCRQIAAVRNAGARQAKGDAFVFVDADTHISEKVLRATIRALDQGAVAGGAWVEFSEPVGWWVRLTLLVFNITYFMILRWAAGCFLFARREAFVATRGFDETLYASEEIFLSRALKRQGRFVVLRESVAASGRKLRMNSPWKIFPFLFRFLRHGPAMLRQRQGLEWWYDGRREKR